jgi:ribosome maturation factor RimP
MTNTIDQLQRLLGPAIDGLEKGVSLWGIEFTSGPSSALLRVYLDAGERPVVLEDCEVVSREISALLDVEDPIPGNYTLEVSSPGLARPLFTPEHFARFVGEPVKITLGMAVDNRRRVQGTIVRVEGSTIVIGAESGEIAVAHENIQKARLVPQFDPPAKPGKPAAGGKRRPKPGAA